MINVNNLDKLKSILGDIFYIGFSRSYSYEYIEEKIRSSLFIKFLEEDNDDSFLYNQNSLKIIEECYPHLDLSEIEELIKYTNSKCLWLGEMYIGLFFKFHKSFSFIFLYMSLSHAEYSYDIYHEMDYSQFYSYFEELTTKETILEKLVEKNNLSYEQLSLLSDISIGTLKNYTRSNEKIYNSKYETLYILSKIFKVNINIFSKDIYNEPVSSMYRYDKEDKRYRSKLGLLYSKYYDKEIRNIDFIYDHANSIYISKDAYFKVIWTDYIEGQGLYFSKENENIINKVEEFLASTNLNISYLNLVIFEFDGNSQSISYYLSLKDKGLKNIIIINQEYYFQINQNFHKTRRIDNRVNEFLSIRAKK